MDDSEELIKCSCQGADNRSSVFISCCENCFASISKGHIDGYGHLATLIDAFSTLGKDGKDVNIQQVINLSQAIKNAEKYLEKQTPLNWLHDFLNDYAKGSGVCRRGNFDMGLFKASFNA